MSSAENHLVKRDQQFVWHPYAPPRASPLYEVVEARGVTLGLADGRELIDGMSSWWAAIHGYRHPQIEEAVQRQLQSLPHVMFGGLTHEPAVSLCERLVELAPGGMQRAFLCDSGSVAVEVAIKIAFQYWLARGHPERKRLLTIRGGYHGDTFATMAVCDPENGMHEFFAGLLASHLFAERPRCSYDDSFEESHIEDFSGLLRSHEKEIAAVILEPIVQGAGGMWFYSPDYLGRVRELCNEFGIPLILDEIATGFGRTGKLFGADHAAIAGDILCLGKALTGGTMTLAATLASHEICETIGQNEPHALMHGPTFMANPLACAAALASLDLLAEEPWAERVRAVESQLRGELEICRDLPGVNDVRSLGAIGVVELETPVDMARVQPAFVERGVWLRPYGRLLYTMPPFIATAEQISVLTAAIHDVIRDVHLTSAPHPATS